ncbi:dynein heavy chain, partial [Cystoisospora suis]
MADLLSADSLPPFIDDLSNLDACFVLWKDNWRSLTVDDLFLNSLQSAKLSLPAQDVFNTKELRSLLSDVLKALTSDLSPRQIARLLLNFWDVYKRKRLAYASQVSHLQRGLTRLGEVSDAVRKLQEEKERSQKTVQEKQEQAEATLQEVARAMVEAEERRKHSQALEAEAQKEENEQVKNSSQIEAELAKIDPEVAEAKKALGAITSQQISEIRSLKVPPEPVRDVLGALLRLLGQSDCSWNAMKRFLGERGSVARLLNFNAAALPQAVRQEVEAMVEAKRTSFEPGSIRRVSVAAAPFAAWTLASLKFSRVIERLAPIRERSDAARASLQTTRDKLQQCRQELAETDGRIAAMKEEFARCTQEAEQLKAGLDATASLIARASMLADRLSEEKERWAAQLGAQESQQELCIPQCMLAAAFLTCLCAEDEDRRREFLRRIHR